MTILWGLFSDGGICEIVYIMEGREQQEEKKFVSFLQRKGLLVFF